MTNITVFFDLDGVLADFDAAALALGFDTENLNKSRSDLSADQRMIKQKLYDTIALTDFFAELPFVPGAEALWASAKSLRPHILTAAPSFRHRDDARVVHNEAAKKKYIWCQERLGLNNPDRFICTLSHKKKDYVSLAEGGHAILIDDRPKNIKEWESAGGIGIFHETADESLQSLQTLVSSLKEK